MCEEKSFIRSLLGSLGASSASGLAKASPGVAVSGLTIYGIEIDSWVQLLTGLYILVMLIGSIPKMAEGIRYVWHLFKPRSESGVSVTEAVDNSPVDRKIEKYRHE